MFRERLHGGANSGRKVKQKASPRGMCQQDHMGCGYLRSPSPCSLISAFMSLPLGKVFE